MCPCECHEGDDADYRVEVMMGDGGDCHDHESRCCCVVDDYLN